MFSIAFNIFTVANFLPLAIVYPQKNLIKCIIHVFSIMFPLQIYVMWYSFYTSNSFISSWIYATCKWLTTLNVLPKLILKSGPARYYVEAVTKVAKLCETPTRPLSCTCEYHWIFLTKMIHHIPEKWIYVDEVNGISLFTSGTLHFKFAHQGRVTRKVPVLLRFKKRND